MIIGIDGNEANQEKRVGVGEYSFQVLTHLKEFLISNLPCRQAGFQFQIYLKEKPLPDLPSENRWWHYKTAGPKFLWTQIGLPLALFQDKLRPDVFFTPTHYSPRYSPCPRVIAIMDLSYIYFPEMFKRGDLWKLENWTAYSVKKAKKILTISKFTRDAIIKYYKVPKEQIVVTYPGVNNLKTKMPNLKSESEISNLKKKYKIEGDYILYVGTLQPRKNLIRLIEAFKKLKTPVLPAGRQNSIFDPETSGAKTSPAKRGVELKTIPTKSRILDKVGTTQNLKLIIAGKKGWMFKEIFQKVKDLRLERQVIFTGYVPAEELLYLYKGAKCFVLVSLYEGFGLPVLEAMKYGTLVVVSNVSSLPEIVGDAGIFVDPYKVDDIARGIAKVLDFDTLKYRSTVEKGLKQAKKFSWEKCARETLEVLMEAAGLKY